jgi:hypothetical protein
MKETTVPQNRRAEARKPSAKQMKKQPSLVNWHHQGRLKESPINPLPAEIYPTKWFASPPGPHRPPTLQLLSDLDVPLSVHPVDVIAPSPAPPRNASGLVVLLRHIEYRANVVNLRARKAINLAVRIQRTVFYETPTHITFCKSRVDRDEGFQRNDYSPFL